ncbi:hypothetical protein EJB05_27644, partial [Eragrostis curvula]
MQPITFFEPLHKLQAHDGYILKCLLSPKFCDPNSSVLLAPSGFHATYLGLFAINAGFGIVFSVDGAYLIVTASSDTTANLWTMTTGEAIGVHQGQHKATT